MTTTAWWGHHLKLRRAYEHLHAIYDYATAVRETDKDTFTSKLQVVDDNAYFVHFMKARRTDMSNLMWIGVLLGDFVHELSSLLDQMIYTLIEANTGRRPREETYFPICENFNDWTNRVANTRRKGKRGDSLSPIAGIRDDLVTVIEQVQPYNGGKGKDPLARLHWLWNTDKHKVVHTAAVTNSDTSSEVVLHTGDGHEIALKDIQYNPGVELKFEAYSEILRATLPKNLIIRSGKMHMTVENPPLEIKLSKRRFTLADLKKMYDTVDYLLRFISEICPSGLEPPLTLAPDPPGV